MKKILTLAVVALMSLTAAAENVYVGGSVSYDRNTTKNVTEFSLLPEFGYNFNDALAVGVQFGYAYGYANNIEKLNLGCFNPYVRYTFFNNDKVNLFVDGAVELGLGKVTVYDNASDTAFKWGVGIKPGVSYAISENFSVVAHIGFIGYRASNNACKQLEILGAADNDFHAGIDGNDLSIGFYVNF